MAKQASGNMWSPWQLIKDTVSQFFADNAQRLGAALAYYAAFSIAPLLVIALAIAGLAFGAKAAQGAINEQLSSMVGDQAAAGIQEMIAAAQKPSHGIIATLIGVVALIFGAAGVFGELQTSLNTIWGVQPKPRRGAKFVFASVMLWLS